MPTRLGQKRVKSSDPAYTTLAEQLNTIGTQGDGTGYTVPDGGIPRTHMTIDVQDALGLAETAYIFPSLGIPSADLESSVQTLLDKASTSYQKPLTGIPETDLEQSIQDRLNDFSSFYVYPSTGIPYVDFDDNVKSILQKAVSAYQLPTTGVAELDLHQDVIDALSLARTAYQKPLNGIPLSDLAETVMSSLDADIFRAHINDTSLHIVDHDQLNYTGKYTHADIDTRLDNYHTYITDIHRTLDDARGSYLSINARLDSIFGQNASYLVDDKEEWTGTFTNLQKNEEGNVTFSFTPGLMQLDFYHITKEDSTFKDVNYINSKILDSGISYNPENTYWIRDKNGNEYYDNVGIRMKGYIYAPYTGEYKFTLYTSGHSKMQVAGRLISETGGLYTSYQHYNRSGHVTLEGGRMYPIIVEIKYYDQGSRVFEMFWNRPFKSFDEELPVAYLNQDGYGNQTTGIYESNVIDLEDAGITKWYFMTDIDEYRVDTDVVAEISTSEDGVTFSAWKPMEINSEIPAIPTRFAKVKMTINKVQNYYTPLIKSFEIRYLAGSIFNHYIQEIELSRGSFLDLPSRLDNVDSALNALSTQVNNLDLTDMHPENFHSLRLSGIELNMLQEYIRDADRNQNYIQLEDGVADHFYTLDFIDEARSDKIAIVDTHHITQINNMTTISSEAEFETFELSNTMATPSGLSLSYSLNDSEVAETYEFNNKNTNGHGYWARLGRRYASDIAQPFYTSSETSRLTYLFLHTRDDNYDVNVYYKIVPTREDGMPDISNPIWTSYGMRQERYRGYGHSLNLDVIPNSKYWIIIDEYWRSDWYAYVDYYMGATSHPRLEGDNHEGKHMSIMKRQSNTGAWTTYDGQTLYFSITEQSSFKPQGTAQKILDYEKKTKFINFEADVTRPEDSVCDFSFQGSEDGVTWSLPVNDITNVPDSRFLKIIVNMVRSTTGNYSPTINEIRIYYTSRDLHVISKPIHLLNIPTHVTFVAEANRPEYVRYYVSRDDGGSWVEVFPSQTMSLHSCKAGKIFRMKAIIDDQISDLKLNYWGAFLTVGRDIHAQNITALYEEYEAQDGQQLFKLSNPYQMGNYSLQVYLNGVRQSIFKDYHEVDQYHIEFIEPLMGGQDGDRITFVVQSGAYNEHDMVLVDRIKTIENIHQDEFIDHDVTYEYNENNKVIKETYTGTPYSYHIVEYEYDINGRKSVKRETKDNKVCDTSYVYDEWNRITKKYVRFSEVVI